MEGRGLSVPNLGRTISRLNHSKELGDEHSWPVLAQGIQGFPCRCQRAFGGMAGESVERARWESPQDIKRVYRSADFLAGNRVIFNIKGNRYRLVVQVVYVGGDVIIEWVGTHAEYTKRRF